MGTASNFITGSNATFMSGGGLTVGDWTATSGTITPTMSTIKKVGNDSLDIKVDNGTNLAQISLDGIYSDPLTEVYQFYAWVMPHASGIDLVNISVSITSPGVTSPVVLVNKAVRSTTEWSLIRSNPIYLKNDGLSAELTVTISFSFDDDAPLYFTLPAVIPHYHFNNNNFLFNVLQFIPDFFIDYDYSLKENGVLPDYPMTRYLDIGTSVANDVMNDYVDFYRGDVEQGRDENNTDTLSQLVDADAMRPEFMNWLSAISGNKFSSSSQSTPWGSLPSTWSAFMQSIDPSANTSVVPTNITRATGVVTATVASTTGFTAGRFVSVAGTTPSSFEGNFVLTSVGATSLVWAQAGSNESASVFGTITLLDTEWGEVAAFAPDTATASEYARFNLRTGVFGNRAGTRSALEEVIEENLINDKVYNIIYSFGGNPWTIKITTAVADTLGGVISTSNAGLLSALELVRPCGFIFVHECV
jgi:hypothetical protein